VFNRDHDVFNLFSVCILGKVVSSFAAVDVDNQRTIDAVAVWPPAARWQMPRSRQRLKRLNCSDGQ